jgi:SAM-dependent methyltransferase
MSAEASGLVPGDHPDRIKWNAKYGAGFVPSFRPNPLAVRALALVLPDGPVADLACGPSGSALLAAEQGRRVTAVDVSEIALGLLGAEARRRGLGHLITLVHADLYGWAPEPRSFALVLGIGFWDGPVFRAAAEAVADGGLLAWEALTTEALDKHPGLPREFCVGPGEPASLLTDDFTVIDQADVPHRTRRCLLARQLRWHGSASPRSGHQYSSSSYSHCQ